MIYAALQHSIFEQYPRASTVGLFERIEIKCIATRSFLLEPGNSPDFTSLQSSATQLPHRANKRAN